MGTDDMGEAVMGTLRGYYDTQRRDIARDIVVNVYANADRITAPAVAVVIPMVAGAEGNRLRYRDGAVRSAQAQSAPVVVMGVHAPALGCGVEAADSAALARNAGLRLAREMGVEYAVFLDDDDLLDRDAVATLIGRARETGADVVYPRFRVRYGSYARRRSLGDLALMMRDAEPEALRAGNFIPVTALVRVAAALDVGGFPVGADIPRHPYPPHPRVEDWGLWLRMLNAGARFAQCPHVLWTWRQWEGSTSAEFWE